MASKKSKGKKPLKRQPKRAAKQVKAPNKIGPEWVEARIYMLRTEQKFLKAAAESHKMSFSEYCRGRVLGGSEIVVTGDFVAAPAAKG